MSDFDMFVLYSIYEISCLRLPSKFVPALMFSKVKETKGSNTYNDNM